jgi:hypothetical protein
VSALWLLLGIAIALINGLSIRWTVGSLNISGARSRAIAVVVGGAVVRVAVAALVLAVALRQGIVEGLLAFAGLWLGRWGAVAILSRGRSRLRTRIMSRVESP